MNSIWIRMDWMDLTELGVSAASETSPQYSSRCSAVPPMITSAPTTEPFSLEVPVRAGLSGKWLPRSAVGKPDNSTLRDPWSPHRPA